MNSSSQPSSDLRRLYRAIVHCTMTVGLLACTPAAQPDPLLAAEAFIDGFYSFDPDTLAGTLEAGEDEARMLYYQAWAQAAHYEIETRRPCVLEADAVVCRITVNDDFGGTLGYVATDTFTLTMQDARIVGVQSEGDDPPVFTELFEWIATNRPEVMKGPCKDMFAGGTTPAQCASAVVESAQDFLVLR